MLKIEEPVTCLSHTTDPWDETNFDEIFKMKTKLQRTLTGKASMQLFHSTSQMALPLWLPATTN